MSEIGEGAAVAKPVETAKKGKVKVTVRDVCTGQRIEGAVVSINGKEKKTVSDEDLLFEDESVGSAGIKVSKHFSEADYLVFLVHNIAFANKSITRSFKAISTESDMTLVEESKTVKARIELPVYKVLESVRLCRVHLEINSIADIDYGHWWIEVGNKSYGWWPQPGHLQQKDMQEPVPPAPLPDNASVTARITHMVQRAAYNVNQARYKANESNPSYMVQAIGKTFWGVPGILNGDEDHKRHEKDPHAGDWRYGKTDEDYHPVIVDCRDKEEIHQAIRDFAFAYSGDWSWRLEGGNNCHTFQVAAMKKLQLDKVKKI